MVRYELLRPYTFFGKSRDIGCGVNTNKITYSSYMPHPLFILKFTLSDPVRANVTKLGQEFGATSKQFNFPCKGQRQLVREAS